MFKHRFIGIFVIFKHIDEISYILELLSRIKIVFIFFVSWLQKHVSWLKQHDLFFQLWSWEIWDKNVTQEINLSL